MKSSRLFEWGFGFAGLFVGIAMGIWASLHFFYGQDGRLGQLVAAGFVIAGSILQQVVKYKYDQSNKTDDKPDA